MSNDDLLKAKLKLEEVNKELKDFSYIASHDLKAPIRAISNYLELIYDNIEEPNEKILNYKNKINQAIRNMNLLITDLLYFSNINDENLTKQKIVVNNQIKKVIDILSDDINKKNCKITVDGSSTIVIEETFIHQILLNLFSNSLKYSNHDLTIKIQIIDDKDSVKILFSDNGIGIDNKYFDDIFKPFKRLHSNDKYEGSGIGLFTCKKITEKNCGGIKVVQSSLGHGTTFEVLLKK